MSTSSCEETKCEGPTTLRLSEAVALGTLLERPGSCLSFKGCALGLAMAAVGVPVQERSAETAEMLWPWLARQARPTWFGLGNSDYTETIGDWYFNFKLGRMTMAGLLSRIRAVEPVEHRELAEALLARHGGVAERDSND